jgi:AhpD family alkylhydroperoxidase
MPRHPSKLSRPDLLAGGVALRLPLRGLSCPGSGAVIHHRLQPNQKEVQMTESMYPQTTQALAQKRRDLAPEIEAAFRQFSQATFRDGALPGKTKQLIAVAVAHVTQCPYCIKGHTRAALRDGATPEELMEAIWVAAEMRAGAAYAHSALALETIETAGGGQPAR